MSTKGMHHTELTKRKISIAKTEHNLPEFLTARDTYSKRLMESPKLLHTIVGYCLEVGISQNNIVEYASKYPEVADIINKLHDLQEEYCLTMGITQQVNPIFSMFLLKAKHNFRDSAVTSATQINNMNISPEVLADAFKLMGKTNKAGK
jgi:hypothetical protein